VAGGEILGTGIAVILPGGAAQCEINNQDTLVDSQDDGSSDAGSIPAASTTSRSLASRAGERDSFSPPDAAPLWTLTNQDATVPPMHTPPEHTGNVGWIEVIAGSMFSGKSEELIRRLRRAEIARQRVQVFKPAIDTRYSADDVVSHSDQRIRSERVSQAREILDRVRADTQVVGIDEAQFFDMDLVEVCERLANRGVRVVVAGLDQDFRGRPFEPIPQLLAIAEYITKTRAICVQCGQPALRSQRLGASTERVMLGAGETYEPRCRGCYADPEAEGDRQLFERRRGGASPDGPGAPG
jgi:thymidine kinase